MNETPSSGDEPRQPHDSLADAVQRVRSSSEPVAGPSGARLVRFDALSKLPDGDGTVVAVVSGPLAPEHASAMRRNTPAQLLSDTATAGSMHLQVLTRLLQGGFLVDAAGPPKEQYRLGALRDLDLVATRAAVAAASWGASKAVASVYRDVVYEATANALLDAPVDEKGNRKYAFRRDESPDIDPQDICAVALGATGSWLWVVARDRFGTLTPAPLAATIGGLKERARMDMSGGGAGLGMRRLLESSVVLACRVVPGHLTEVLSVVTLSEVRRRASEPKSVFFWVERG